MKILQGKGKGKGPCPCVLQSNSGQASKYFVIALALNVKAENIFTYV